MTLDQAQEAFEARPRSSTAWQYFEVAQEYAGDGMIGPNEFAYVKAQTKNYRDRSTQN